MIDDFADLGHRMERMMGGGWRVRTNSVAILLLLLLLLLLWAVALGYGRIMKRWVGYAK